MKTEFNSRNKIALFHDLCQNDEQWSKWACSFFAPAINLKYNCWIVLTEEDIKIIAKRQNSLGLFSYTKWWYGSNWVKSVYQYVKDNAEERGWEIPNLITFRDEDNEVLKWINRWYACIIWIWVNREFGSDAIDWKIEKYEDYNKYKWTSFKHFTNLLTFTWRFTKDPSEYKDYILDSTAFNEKNQEWLYECDVDKVLESFDMPSKYIFFK